MVQENAKVNLHIPADRVPGILGLRQEWSHSREATIQEMHRSLDGFIEIIERRVAFFDRLILLAGGSFALQPDARKHLAQDSSEHLLLSTGCLKAAWVLMLICIVFSWIHNWYRVTVAERIYLMGQKRVGAFQHQVNAGFADRGSRLFEGITAEDVDLGEFYGLLKSYSRSESEKASSVVDQTLREAKAELVKAIWIGNLALLCVVVSFALLLVFAIRNVAFL